jgi:replication factor C subunit 2/4
MTSDSQFALRRIMEQYSKITRFCIICNYHTKIIDPIISRCSVFHFKPINNEHLISKLEYICKEEKINYPKDLLIKIIELSRGDLRRAINFLQKCSGFININIDEVFGILPNNIIDSIFTALYNKDIHKIDMIINKLYNDGYSLVNQILVFHNRILKMDINSYKKAQILHILGLIDHQLIKGSNEYILFMKLVYFIMKTI